MCWSEGVSLGTAVSATFFSILLLLRRQGIDVGIALFALTVALMQLGEAWMWRGLQDPAKATGGARLGILSLLLQPLVLGCTVLVYRGFPTYALLFAFVWILAAWRSFHVLLAPAAATPGPHGHLEWNFLPAVSTPEFMGLYWPVLLGAWYFLPAKEAWLYGVGAAGSVGISKLLYPREWGTLWCWWANLLPVVRLVC